MDADYERWHDSPRSLAQALGIRTTWGSEESRFYRALGANQSRIGTVGLNLKAHVVAAVWRTLFRRSPTFVVVATPTQMQWFFQAAEQHITRCEGVRNRVWIGREHSGLALAHSQAMLCVGLRPQDITDRLPVDSMVIVPNIDAVDGKFLKVAAELEALGKIKLVVNAPSRA